MPARCFVDRPRSTEPACRVGSRPAATTCASKASRKSARGATGRGDRASRPTATSRSASRAARATESAPSIRVRHRHCRPAQCAPCWSTPVAPRHTAVGWWSSSPGSWCRRGATGRCSPRLSPTRPRSWRRRCIAGVPAHLSGVRPRWRRPSTGSRSPGESPNRLFPSASSRSTRSMAPDDDPPRWREVRTRSGQPLTLRSCGATRVDAHRDRLDGPRRHARRPAGDGIAAHVRRHHRRRPRAEHGRQPGALVHRAGLIDRSRRTITPCPRLHDDSAGSISVRCFAGCSAPH